MGLDNHYIGTFKQTLLTSFIGRIYLKKITNKLWVPGSYQYEYAIKLGFNPETIITDLYCADTSRFYYSPVQLTKKILFVGRLVEYKGIAMLVKAFNSFNKTQRNDWKLIIIGNGPLKNSLQIQKSDDIEIYDFMQPDKLAQFTFDASIFCLPSWRENWGVVVHEFALQGKALLLSNKVESSQKSY
ncbi:MAG: glycosyltransferase [Lewinellaceae bacterium]|nr:glycosyltransferase [Lewinellaceae bacterium]